MECRRARHPGDRAAGQPSISLRLGCPSRQAFVRSAMASSRRQNVRRHDRQAGVGSIKRRGEAFGSLCWSKETKASIPVHIVAWIAGSRRHYCHRRPHRTQPNSHLRKTKTSTLHKNIVANSPQAHSHQPAQSSTHTSPVRSRPCCVNRGWGRRSRARRRGSRRGGRRWVWGGMRLGLLGCVVGRGGEGRGGGESGCRLLLKDGWVG